MNSILPSLKNYATAIWQDPKTEILKAKDALVNQIALDTFVKCFVFTGCVIFKIHIGIYAFVGGIVFADAIYDLAKRVNNIFAAKKSTFEATILYGGGGFLAFLGWPSTFTVMCLYYSANLGSEISRKYNPESQQQRERDLEIVRRNLQENAKSNLSLDDK